MKFYTVSEAAIFLNVSEQTIYRLKNKGDLKSAYGSITDTQFTEYELNRYVLLETLSNDTDQLQITDNQEHFLIQELNNELKDPSLSKVIITVAYLKSSGWNLIRNDLYTLLRNNGEVEIITGLDFCLTDTQPLFELLSWKSEGLRVSLHCCRIKNKSYHPKFYCFIKNSGSRTAFLGSSNLTEGGLDSNIELNIRLNNEINSNTIDQLIYIFYANLLRSNQIFTPSSKLLEEYENARKSINNHRKQLDGALKELEKSISPLITSHIEISKSSASGYSQERVITEALATLPSKVEDGWIHLQQIYEYVLAVNNRENLGWNIDSIETSVRGCLNNNFVAFDNPNNKKGKGIFLRKQNRGGLYKLNLPNN